MPLPRRLLLAAMAALALCSCAPQADRSAPAGTGRVALAPGAAAGAPDFAIANGDHVVFYGDSITDQRLYTTFVETYIRTRFPAMDVRFTHSGWGGDRVGGGGGGGIRQRLERDVIAYQPTMVTVMLGMNDGRYRAFDPMIFEIYSNGYKNLVGQLKKALPQVRITAIQPSPYDDVTRKPNFPGGYNATLLRYSDFLAELAAAEGLMLADLNRPVVAALEKALTADPKLAEQISPDRVHPRPPGHLLMAAELLKAWKAPALVSAVEVDAAAGKVTREENTEVTDASFSDGVAWIQRDAALPLPIDLSDPVMALAVKAGGVMEALNQQTLAVKGLAAGKHTLLIDGDVMGVFDAEALSVGVNLAAYKTPMWAKAMRVHQLTLDRANAHNTRWRNVQVPFEEEQPEATGKAMAALDALRDALQAEQQQAAQPDAHRFELLPGDRGFAPIFNGKDLEGWHISKTNHHGTTPVWRVADGVLSGTQDRPGEGGILLTDKKYKNFEISLELRPDFGCDGGLFLRATEKGEAYQVMLDYLDGGSVGGIYGEGLKGVQGTPGKWRPHWKSNDWNHLRARIEGDTPRIRVWMNGTQIVDWTDTGNHLPEGATDGHIAVQVHRGNRWIPGGEHRFRNIAVRELP
ncbi:MAG: DUF1080 domain-containing protein [Bryobacterales bacterium]|jgi:lysophospholipase L1-like esterase|nr:DUF1080 domain-containing protein [Bryobacterales bacterium]